MTPASTEGGDAPADSRLTRWLWFLKLVLTVLTLAVSLWKALASVV